MTEINILVEDRIIGQKAILGIMGKLYDINSWNGAIEFIEKYNLPLRRTQSGRPMFLKSELILFEAKYQNKVNKTS